MAYDYTTLKFAARKEEALGKWNGVPVYAISKNDLSESNKAWYYIVYDDNNALVRDGYRLGTVGENGNVTELARPTRYKYYEAKTKAEVEVKVEELGVPAQTVPLVDAGANDFFLRIEAEIDALLKSEFKFDGAEFVG